MKIGLIGVGVVGGAVLEAYKAKGICFIKDTEAYAESLEDK